jgi:hypothetical protein
MGLFHSIIRICPCSAPRRTAITPETISHPYPLAPKHAKRHGHEGSNSSTATAKSRFRPQPDGVYRQLHSPVHSKYSSDATGTTATTTTSTTMSAGQPLELGLGLGLGLGIGQGGELGPREFRPPERAYILGDRRSGHDSTSGSGTGSGSGRGRKLKKTRLVEGDWELVRTDQDWKQDPKTEVGIQGGGNQAI